MNRVLIALVAVLSAAGMLMAVTTTNRMGPVVVSTVGADGVVVTTITSANGAASVTNRTVLPVGWYLDKAAVTVPTLYTPRNYGDGIIGQTGLGTGSVWIATGLTSNDWAKLN
jgi:hypothetical protein